MKIEKFDKDYQVRDYTMKHAGGVVTLKWKYARGTHFFVMLYDGRREIDLEGITGEMEDKGLDDRTIIQKSSHHIYTTSDEKVKVFLFREKEFMNNGQSCTLPGSEVKKAIPYGISVFIGEYNRDEGIIHLYEGKNPDANTQFVPVKLEPVIRYRPRLFSREKLCFLQVPKLQDCEDGALQYHVDGIRMTYPLPSGCMGKEIVIAVPKDAEVAIRVADRYKKYYRV